MSPTHRLALAAAGLALFYVGSAYAGGSVQLDELKPVFSRSLQLSVEVDKELASKNMEAGSITCSAVRLGRQWEHLGGARVGPYECDFGDRKLTVTTQPSFFDRRGVQIQSSDRSVGGKARSVVESDLSWEWKSTK